MCDLSVAELCRPNKVPPVAQVQDLEYPGPAGPMRMRIYNPTPDAPGLKPALIYIHGGGWCIDNIECHDSICRDLARQSNVVVFSLDYRLAPEHPFPAGPEDCYAAVQYIHRSAKQFDIDHTRLALGGDSAGANLTAAVLLLTHERHGAPIAFEMLLYPVLHMQAKTESRRLYTQGYNLDPDLLNWAIACYGGGHDLADPLLSPLLAKDLSFMPPATILTAGFDPLRDEGKLYADRLQQQGVTCTYKCYEGMIHGFLNHMFMVQLDVGEEAMADLASQLRNALHVSARK